MLKLKRLSILLIVVTTILLGTASCGQNTWGSYTLIDQVTMDYPSGWYVDAWGATPSSVRFMLPEGDDSLAHTRIFVNIWDKPEDLSYAETVKLDNGIEFVGVYGQDPDMSSWDAIYWVDIDSNVFLDIQAYIPYNSEFESSALRDICLHMIASMRVAGE